MTLSRTERQKLVALMRKVGPDAPTLCDGWTVKDLAVHLVVRENHPKAALGVMYPPAKNWLSDKVNELSAADIEVLLERLETGSRIPPVRWVDRWLNGMEYFIHHEDVRRAQPSAPQRRLAKQQQAELLHRVRFFAPLILKNSEVPVVFEPDSAPRFVAYDHRGVTEAGDGVATVRGPIEELAMWLFGRASADVDVEDPQEGIRRSSL